MIFLDDDSSPSHHKVRWLDRSEETIPFPFDEKQYRVYSPMMERLVIEAGKLGHALNTQYLLVEPSNL